MRLKRLVIKIGTNLITKAQGIDAEFLEHIAEEVLSARKNGVEVVVVSSGAIGAGSYKLGLKSRPKELMQKQAAAAVGQVILMETYEKAFGDFGLNVAQILLTKADLETRQRYLNVRNTLNALLEMGVVPVINENDTVSAEEIEFGDNDTLSAIIAAKLEADCLAILTDVDGLYMGDPKKDSQAKIIRIINEITPEIERYVCEKPGSTFSTGGMATKLKAAKIAVAAGVTMFIVNGKKQGVISDIINGIEAGSCFLPAKHAMDSKKRWIAYGAKSKGKIFVDNGAEKALIGMGKSLLASGVVRVEGDFEPGDTVSIFCSKKEIAKGITAYSSRELSVIIGKSSSQIKDILKRESADEVVHRNNMVVL